MVNLVCVMLNNLIQRNFSIVFLLYNISHFILFLFSSYFLLCLYLYIPQFFVIEVQLIHVTMFVLRYSTGRQYFYGINFIEILLHCEVFVGFGDELFVGVLVCKYFFAFRVAFFIPEGFLCWTPASKLK